MGRMVAYSIALVLLAGCSPPLALQIPVNRMDPPQTLGARKFALELGPKGASRIEFMEDAEFYELDPPDQVIFDDRNDAIEVMDVTGRYGIAKRVDVSLSISTSDVTNSVEMLKLKVQPFGPTRAEPSDGNLSLAATAGVGFADVRSDESTTHKEYRARVSARLYDAALIAGAYLSERAQLYGGVFTTRAPYDGRYSYARDGVRQIYLAFDGTIRSTGWNVGLDFVTSRNTRIMIEFARSDIEVGALQESVNRLGLTTQLTFR